MGEIGDGGGLPNGRVGVRAAACARIFDVPEDDAPAAIGDRVGPVFAEEVFLAAGSPAWFDPTLTDRERSMGIIAALAALGGAGEPLDNYVRLSRRNGLGYEALTAMMTLISNYIGQARRSQAIEAVEHAARARAHLRHRQTPDRTSLPGHRPGSRQR